MALTPEQRARLEARARAKQMQQAQPPSGNTLEYRTGMGASSAGSDTLNYRPEMASSSTQGETMQYRGGVALPPARPSSSPVPAPTAGGLTAEQRARLDARARQKQAQAIPAAPEVSEKEPSFFSRLGADFKRRGGEVLSTFKEAAEGRISPVETGIRVVGQGAALGGDVIGQGLTSVARTVIPKSARDFVGEKVGEAAIAVGLPRAMEVYEGFSQANPRTAKTLEGVVNIASLLPQKKVADVAATATKPALKEVSKQVAKRSISKIDDVVDESFVRAVRPSATNFPSAAQKQSYLDKAKKAVSAIADNEPNMSILKDGERVGLPQSLQQLEEAIGQTKKEVFKRYSAEATKAGEAGAIVDLNKAADELRKMADNVVLQDKDPGLVKSIREKAKTLTKRGSYTPEQAQDAIKLYNESLEAFYRNPSYDTASRAAADAVIANNLRSSLDDAVGNLTGAQYQEMKNIYGALKTIEKDVSRRALVDARKNASGLLDFTDIATGAGAVNAILTMEPASFTAAATGKLIKELIKRRNDPNLIIKNMFDKVKKAKEQSSRFDIYPPKSSIVKKQTTLPKRKAVDMSVE